MAALFDELASLLQGAGEKPFKIRLSRRGTFCRGAFRTLQSGR
jgi:hypothetical protein